MKIDNKQFLNTAQQTIEDPVLQAAYDKAIPRFNSSRQDAFALVPDVEELRRELKAVRAATIADLGTHLQTFERNAQAAGAVVHWANHAQQVGQIVLDIARRRRAKLIAKSKSMVTEELHLNQVLESAGIKVVETDLGEYIIQLANERPSHIIGPAIHKTARQVRELFIEKLHQRVDEDPAALTDVARHALREIFINADIGISGVNLGVAETGSVVLVTNEGNGRMVTSLPPVHIAVMGIERLAPDWGAAAVWLSLLARAATGQAMSIYTSVITGPARADDLDGPKEVHIILVDNQRSAQIGTKYEEILQCIRCGACLAACPVYGEAGGHAYHSPYSGPIGAVISPLLFGLENYPALPQASSLCGACLEVCPVQIDLPRMLLALRVDSVEQGLVSPPMVAAEKISARMMKKPGWMQFFFKTGRIGQLMLKLFNISFNGFENYPMVSRQSFRDLWKRMEADDDRQR
ncbi:MAG: iron-sulfur cluster-binding protein [Anaerolineales bacterium]|nr:iron-sulfur cluster-binding protein [Anaerolineales bacterium]